MFILSSQDLTFQSAFFLSQILYKEMVMCLPYLAAINHSQIVV